MLGVPGMLPGMPAARWAQRGACPPQSWASLLYLYCPFCAFFMLNALGSKKLEGGADLPPTPTLKSPLLCAPAWAPQENTSPKHSLFAPPLACALGQAAHPMAGGTPTGPAPPAAPGSVGRAGRQRGGSGEQLPGAASPPLQNDRGQTPPPGTPADGRPVWGPGDLPWFLQLLLTHFCSSCSHSPQRVPHPTAPQTPEGCRCGHQQGLYFGEGGEGKQLLGRQHPPATWKPQFPWKPFFAPIILPLPHPLICL